MTITWLGHACFCIEEDGYRLVIDPYTGVEGYPDIHTEAHAVYCSHGHFDHNFTQGVTLLPERACPFSVQEIPAFHDDQGGALRGSVTIRVFSANGVRVCHLGDLGHRLSEEQAAAIGPLDVLLVPVGGGLHHRAGAGGGDGPETGAPVRCAHALPPCPLWPAEGGGSGAVPVPVPRRKREKAGRALLYSDSGFAAGAGACLSGINWKPLHKIEPRPVRLRLY